MHQDVCICMADWADALSLPLLAIDSSLSKLTHIFKELHTQQMLFPSMQMLDSALGHVFAMMKLPCACWQIGGIGPELDEDFSTSYLMTTHGYKGAFSLRTVAGISGHGSLHCF